METSIHENGEKKVSEAGMGYTKDRNGEQRTSKTYDIIQSLARTCVVMV